MIFHRLKVSDYRGIDSFEVEFAPTGITVIQGPNEIGKSSFMQAVTTLFDLKASARSNNREIRRFKPLHSDAGPEIELEAESGPYRFVYRKRFLKDPIAELRLTSPKEEFVTGEAAHDRVLAILKETLDRTLWDALRIQQGSAIALPKVNGADGGSLMAALDLAASGGSASDPGSDSAHRKAKEEYERYFTPERGAPGRLIQESTTEAERLRLRVAELDGQLRDLGDTIRKSENLRERIAGLAEREAALTDEHGIWREAVADIDRLAALVSEQRERRRRAEEALAEARRRVAERKELMEAVKAASKGLETARNALAHFTPAAEATDRLVEDSTRAAVEAERVRNEALAATVLRRRDFEFFRNLSDLEQMRERLRRVEASQKKAEEAQAELAENGVTDEAAKEILAADEAVRIAAARLEGSSPGLRLEALADGGVVIDGESAELRRAEIRELSVTERIRVEVPGRLVIQVAAGSGADRYARELDSARTRLAELLRAHGAGTADQVQDMARKRRDAMRLLSDHKRIMKENLRDLEFEGGASSLAGKVRRLELAVQQYSKTREMTAEMPQGLEGARLRLDEALPRHQEAEAAWLTAVEARVGAQNRRTEAREHLATLQEQVNSAKTALERAMAELARSREFGPDAELDAAATGLEKEFGDAAATLAGMEAQLDQRRPESARERLETTAGSLESIRAQKAEAERERDKLRIELEVRGGEGLYEQLCEAESELRRAERAEASIRRSAEAARVLWTTLDGARNRSRLAYVAPLREEIERLGRDVFDGDFTVEVDEGLQIATRTTNGVPVPFGELSGGAQEQLSLIHRAACSLLVSQHGGMPLILDDALGYSDAERLKGMGLALARAAKHCQIIILTCMPDRYSYVGRAKVVELRVP